MSINPNTVKSQTELNPCNDGKRSTDVLLSTIDELAEQKKENQRLRDVILTIQYQTAVLGGSKKDMERALLDIDNICDWVLRPEEMEEMERNNGI